MNVLKNYYVRKRNAWEVEFKTPKAVYEDACQRATKSFYISGAERFESKYSRLNIRLIFLVVDLVLYLVLSVWCISELWGDMVDVIFCIATIGVAFQGFMKLICFTNIKIYELHQFNLQFYAISGEFREVHGSLMEMAMICKSAVHVLEVFYPFIASFVLTFPVLISLINQTFELPFGFFFPAIDRNSLGGYLINYAYHALQLFEAIVGLQACEMCFFVFIISGIAQLDVLIILLRKLSLMAESANKTEVFGLLKEILEQHVKHIEYLTKMEKLMKSYFLINFGCLIAETVTSLYVLATVDEIWYPGIIIVFGGVFQLGVPCVLGTLLSNKNDQFIREIYNTSWNQLPIPEQKILQLLLRSAQNPVILSDGFSPINLFNFVAIFKKIYSCLAMLLSID